jgi:hypothetical protein
MIQRSFEVDVAFDENSRRYFLAMSEIEGLNCEAASPVKLSS